MIRKSRKGISPIIATVLLILIAIATGVIIYAFATGWVGSRITSSGPSSMISIEATSIKETSSTNTYNITLYIRNIGSTKANISGVYLIDPSSGNILGANTTSSKFVPSYPALNPGEVSEVSCNITTTTSLNDGYSYQIKVTTTDGSFATTTVVYHK